MSPTDPQQDVHDFLSRELTPEMLLTSVKRWQRTFPAWRWHYAQDALLPGDWVLDLSAPTGQTYSFFLHPVGTQLRLTAPHALALST